MFHTNFNVLFSFGQSGELIRWSPKKMKKTTSRFDAKISTKVESDNGSTPKSNSGLPCVMEYIGIISLSLCGAYTMNRHALSAYDVTFNEFNSIHIRVCSIHAHTEFECEYNNNNGKQRLCIACAYSHAAHSPIKFRLKTECVMCVLGVWMDTSVWRFSFWRTVVVYTLYFTSNHTSSASI